MRFNLLLGRKFRIGYSTRRNDQPTLCRVRRFTALAFAAFVLVACNTGKPATGSESNWLKACDSDSDCSIGFCVCRVCSQVCDDRYSCVDWPDAVCAKSGNLAFSAHCGQSEDISGICLPKCLDDADCSKGQRCKDNDVSKVFVASNKSIGAR